MKQNISEEQLQELSEEQKIKLSALYKPTDEFSIIKTDWYLGLPLLSIGQMIEILINNNEFFNISNVYVKHPTTSDRSINNGYGIWLHKQSKEYRADELCNALWLAVKNIL
jgi:hypothetical protein